MSLDYQLELVARRAKVFGELKSSYPESQRVNKGYETNDLGNLKKRLYQNYWKNMNIPKKLVDESEDLLNEREVVEFYLFRCHNKIEKEQNKGRIVDFFRRCENVEKKLYEIIFNYKKKYPKVN